MARWKEEGSGDPNELAKQLTAADGKVPWSLDEDNALREAAAAHPQRNFRDTNLRWKVISEQVQRAVPLGAKRGKRDCRDRYRALKDAGKAGAANATPKAAAASTPVAAPAVTIQVGAGTPTPMAVDSPMAPTPQAVPAAAAAANNSGWSADEDRVLIRLAQQFPAKDAKGTKIKSNVRWGNIKTEMHKALPTCDRGKAELRDRFKALDSQ